MRSNGWALPMLLLLAACTPAADEPANEADAPAAEEEAAPVPSLAGDWRVSAINGRGLTQPHPMDASFTGDRLTIRSDCVRMAWDYHQDRNIVTFGSVSESGCPGSRMPDESQVQGAISQANIAMFSQNGDEVNLSGPGGSVTMTRR